MSLRRLPSPIFFLLLFLPLAAIMAAGAWIFVAADFEQRLTRRQALEASNVVLSASALERALGGAAEDIAFLALLPRLQLTMAQPTPEHLDQLSETLSVFLESKRFYDQIRWLDEAGMEQARVTKDHISGRARTISQNALQDKSGRYYFKEAKQLPAGSIYLSPFDLNVENNVIERPFNPTLRLATPLIDNSGQRHGILVLHLFGKSLLQRMVSAAGDMDRMNERLMLLNRDGYWLQGTRAEDEWGFMFGQTGKTIGRRHPDAWRRMLASEKGQVVLDDGMWTWRQLRPVAQLQRTSRTSSPSSSAMLGSHAGDYVWLLAAHLPPEELAAIRHAAWQRLTWPLPAIGSIALLACALLTRYRARIVALDSALGHRLAEAEANNHQLSAQERFIRTITDHLPSKIGYWDAQLHCRFANAAYRNWFGKRAEEMIGLPMHDLLGDNGFTQNEAAIRGALAGQAQRFERCDVKADGTSAYLLTNYIPDIAGDKVDGFYVLSTDITEIKQAGMKLNELNSELSRRVGEVEAATRAKDDFLSNMSHEIRTPLNAILGLAYLLESRPLESDEKDLVHKIRGAGRLLLGIISDILDYSKIEAGRLELEHVPFQLGDVLDGVAAIMSTVGGDKDLELTVDAVPAGAEYLVGDALRLGQVLNNLISNAIKFTEHGSVSLHVRDCGASGRSIRLRFAVCDTGVGIPADKHALIFAPFSQADSSTTRKYGGTGLGLSISRYLVQQMGGELAVNSTPGKGSEFRFTLPFDIAEKDYAAPPSMAMQRVLIVDDSAIARDSLRATVQSLGWYAETVDSGAAALERCQTQAATGRPFDLLLVDWKMPGMDGLEVSKAVRTSSATAQPTPILSMVTAFSREMLMQNPDVAFTDLVLTKPVTASILYNAVAEAKRRREPGEFHPTSGATGQQLQGLRVLVVDDSEINCEVAARILEGEGAHVVTVSDGQSAVDWLRQRPDEVDVVLMDVQMPVMDGYEATRLIRTELKRGDLPVVALSAGAFSYQREAALAAGMNDFLAKPFDVDAMIATLQRLTGWQAMPAEKTVDEPAATETTAAPSPPPILPGIDTSCGLRAWGNDTALFSKYLHQFATSYAQAGHTIATCCEAGDTAGAAALSHKLAGTAGNLALFDIERLAREINTALHGASPAAATSLTSLGESLQAALDTMLASLVLWDEFAAVSAVKSAEVTSRDAAATAQLLRDLLSALDRDSPRHAEPILDQLAMYLPADALHAIREQVDTFDFRGAEAQSRAVAARLGITLE